MYGEESRLSQISHVILQLYGSTLCKKLMLNKPRRLKKKTIHNLANWEPDLAFADPGSSWLTCLF